MKRFHWFWESLLLQSDAIAPNRVILLISPMVIALLAILGLAVQLNRQISDQQGMSLNRIAHVSVRNFAQLQREHLRLTALIAAPSQELSRQAISEQGNLVWSRLRVLENSSHFEILTPTVKELLYAYRTSWVELQPDLRLWLQGNSNETLQAALLVKLDAAEKVINQAIAESQLDYESRIVAWMSSSSRLNGLLNGASVGFLLMMLLTTYVLYQFFQVQERIEQGLRNSEQRLRAILDTIPDAVFRLNQCGLCVDVKPPKNFCMAVATEATIGKVLVDLLPTAAAGPVRQAIQKVLSTGQEQLCEYQLPDETTAETRSYEARLLPSGPNEVQMIVRDITVDKQLEEATLQAQKLESLGVLAGGIAHDFNNLLTGMLAQASLAKLKLLKGLPAVPHIDKAVLSAERAADLTHQLLAYAGKGKFQITALDVNQLIRDTADLMQMALSSSASFRLDLEDGLPLIAADRGQMQQVVMNLFINAVEALGEQEGNIHIGTKSQWLAAETTSQGYVVGNLLAGSYVVVQVTDNGAGMSQEVLSRIFDPFFSTKSKGHGLGLSATLGIIRLHNGGLQVQSQPGRGTTFTVLLPALPDAPQNSVTKTEIVGAPLEQRQTILVIDDEAPIRDAAYDILSGRGFTVIAAASGQEGVEQFHRLHNQIGVVLLDMKMPGLDGRQTYQLLRQIEPNLKVILMSGYSETEVSTQLGQEIAFLAKPYSATLLTDYVERALRTN
ncbi:MAG: response regulator [Caldilineaceae bacterium]|nr:response regulator [Caldilineaceae bacterium]